MCSTALIVQTLRSASASVFFETCCNCLEFLAQWAAVILFSWPLYACKDSRCEFFMLQSYNTGACFNSNGQLHIMCCAISGPDKP